ncbi:F-box SKIP1-like [Olea europaea subsp. europaea]|uniref:F-box SKIP1-like n=1 Tax=Olea europaea subsp. europaea TaxID=158383 RepID=A0A8S0SAX1_OLEEU|nr:F-box SKIP1-like [Olea europaea subsp. europaea]
MGQFKSSCKTPPQHLKLVASNEINQFNCIHRTNSTIEDENQGNFTDSGELVHNWAELTRECLINILSRLSLEDRWMGAMLVCKAWLQVCIDPCLSSVFDLATHFDSVTDLPRFWTPEFESRIDNMIGSVVGWSGGSLTEIRGRDCSDRSLSLVARRCPYIKFTLSRVVLVSPT